MASKRLYSLFERHGSGWRRISEIQCTKAAAVRVFQNALLAPYFSGTPMPERQLRPVPMRVVA